MKYTIFTLLIALTLLSCNKDKKGIETQNACESSNPVEEVTWIKALKSNLTNCSCEMSIIQGKYNGQTVYYVMMTDPLCDGISTPTLFDCNGKVVRTFTLDDYQEFPGTVSPEKVLYRCKTTQ